MAKPIAVQKLKHGKALCGKTFGGFVDTFNWLVDFCQSLKGDKDANQTTGTITLDRADPSAPVIRGTMAKGGGGDLDRDYFKVQNKDSDDGHAIVEMDARTDSTPTVRIRRDGETNVDIALTGGTSPAMEMHDDGGAHSITEASSFYAQSEDSDEVTVAADGGSHNVSIRTSDATQGDVAIRECNYYDGSPNQPVKVNVLASQAFDIGRPSGSAVTGIAFAINTVSGVKKLQASVETTNFVTGQTSTSTVDVCILHDVGVVTDTDYTNPDFTQQKESVTVIGAAPSSSATPETVFTTTPLSDELTS